MNIKINNNYLIIVITIFLVVVVNCLPDPYKYINIKVKKIPLIKEDHDNAVELIRQVYGVEYDNPCAYRWDMFSCSEGIDENSNIFYYVHSISVYGGAPISFDLSKFKYLRRLYLLYANLEYDILKILYK